MGRNGQCSTTDIGVPVFKLIAWTCWADWTLAKSVSTTPYWLVRCSARFEPTAAFWTFPGVCARNDKWSDGNGTSSVGANSRLSSSAPSVACRTARATYGWYPVVIPVPSPNPLSSPFFLEPLSDGISHVKVVWGITTEPIIFPCTPKLDWTWIGTQNLVPSHFLPKLQYCVARQL